MNSRIEISVQNRIDYYVEGRVFEWAMGLAMLLVGIQLVIWPESVQASGFRYINLIISQKTLASIMLLLGWSRCAALMLNGQSMFGVLLGPYVRAGVGVLASIIWIQFVIALIQLSSVQGYPSIGIPFWIMFTVSELYAAYTTIKNR